MTIIHGSGFGPTLYVIVMADLHTSSEIKQLFKFVDDTNLIIPKKADVCLFDEFDHIKKLAKDTKIIINFSKTKEIVFRSSNPRLYIRPHSLDAVEQVLEAKLLGVVLDHKFNFDTRIDFVLTLCSQRVYVLKLLRDQGLSHKNLDIIFRQ